MAAVQTLPDWQWCTAKLNGHVCASGLGNATSSMTPEQADPSLSAGAAPRFEETPIAAALRARASDFVLDPRSGLKSLLVDVHSHRGHELGSIGVVIRPDSAAPPAEAMRSAIQERFRATL